jgi:hypothetical protein
MSSTSKKLQAALLMTSLLGPLTSVNAMMVALDKGFVKKLKDRVTITTKLRIDKHHPRPNSVDKDGDVHMAGRDSVVLLPMVAEIPNGINEPDAMETLLQTSAGDEIKITGVWRLWFEHPSADGTLQTQGDTVPKPKDSNPKHIFEIHPITLFAGIDCGDSFLPIVDDQKHPTEFFEATPAETAFTHYNTRKVEISRSTNGIMIDSKKAVYNYTEFFIKLAGKPKPVEDGFIAAAQVSGTKNFSEPLLVPGTLRMIFAEDTPPAKAVKNLTKGAKLHVIGVPRVNLHDVFDRASVLAIGEKSVGPLPYEMIIVAIIK